MDKKQEFLKRLLATFKIEAEENVSGMSTDLIELEKNPADERKSELIEIIFRAAHSLKGASRAVNLSEIESVCQSFESVMSALKNELITLTPIIFDVLHQTVDLINDILVSSEEKIPIELTKRITNVIKNLSLISNGKSDEIVILTAKTQTPPIKKEETIEHPPEPQQTKQVLPDPKPETSSQTAKPLPQQPETKKLETIRVSTKKLDNLLFQAEEMLSLKLASMQQSNNLRDIVSKLDIWNKESSEVFSSIRNIKQELEKKEKNGGLTKQEKDGSRLVQFCEWGISHISSVLNDITELRKFTDQETYLSGTKIETLLEDVKDIITIPFSTLLDNFPKTVRDMSKDLGKEIDLDIIGDDTEIDRRILEDLRIPLLHILRNCVDYGIEKPEIRLSQNKSKQGTINIKIERLENNKIEVLVSDDGAGINTDKLRKLYSDNEKKSEEEVANMPEAEIFNYIFQSGISTSKIVTDISGRGLGLAIVQEKIEQLGGTIAVESEKGIGTTFKIELPLSLVTFRGILISVSEKEFIVPTTKVQRVLRLNQEEIVTIENKATIPFEGKVIPFVNLCSILELPIKESDSEFVQTLVFGTNGKQVGFAIDDIIDEQEVLVKNFNKHLARVRNISGATVLGSGKVVPIVNATDLIKSAGTITTLTTKQEVVDESDEEQKSIIVVEDSITSRMLLKNILETAGYLVTTAIDGVDGFTKIKETDFDAIVSDVEMPRMNGFDLTAKIRDDRTVADKPVILVTSLSKREDRERGIDVGANAYIVKSSFDQSNLLEILERLI